MTLESLRTSIDKCVYTMFGAIRIQGHQPLFDNIGSTGVVLTRDETLCAACLVSFKP